MTREEAINILHGMRADNLNLDDLYIKDKYEALDMAIKALEQEPKIGNCKDCKWWKDSDGAYRRGCGAESQCPINRKEVYEGNAYCFLYEPQESEG